MFHIANLERFKNLIKDLIEKFVPERLKKYTSLLFRVTLQSVMRL